MCAHQALPTTSVYDEYAYTLNQTNQQILLTGTQGGVYYILLNGMAAAAGGITFTFATLEPPFGIRGVSPGEGGNVGQTTITVLGEQLSRATRVSLVGPGGTSDPALAVDYQNGDTLCCHLRSYRSDSGRL